MTPQLDTDIIQVSSVKELSLRGDPLGLYRTHGEIGPTVTHGDAEFYIGETSYLNMKVLIFAKD